MAAETLQVSAVPLVSIVVSITSFCRLLFPLDEFKDALHHHASNRYINERSNNTRSAAYFVEPAELLGIVRSVSLAGSSKQSVPMDGLTVHIDRRRISDGFVQPVDCLGRGDVTVVENVNYKKMGKSFTLQNTQKYVSFHYGRCVKADPGYIASVHLSVCNNVERVGDGCFSDPYLNADTCKMHRNKTSCNPPRYVTITV